MSKKLRLFAGSHKLGLGNSPHPIFLETGTINNNSSIYHFIESEPCLFFSRLTRALVKLLYFKLEKENPFDIDT